MIDPTVEAFRVDKRLPIGLAVPTGPRGGTHRDHGSNIPNPRYHRYRVTHTGSY